jgi:hypothetical protein
MFLSLQAPEAQPDRFTIRVRRRPALILVVVRQAQSEYGSRRAYRQLAVAWDVGLVTSPPDGRRCAAQTPPLCTIS